MLPLTLYTTSGCHLCEQAFQLYKAVGRSTALSVTDIAFDEKLFFSYGVTIPVISYQNDNDEIIEELGWPFNESELSAWLNKHGIN